MGGKFYLMQIRGTKANLFLSIQMTQHGYFLFNEAIVHEKKYSFVGGICKTFSPSFNDSIQIKESFISFILKWRVVPILVL